jgi:1-deoxy-D-xylulose-5-phosphate synthase
VPIKDQPRLIEIGKAEVVRSFANNGGRRIALFALGNMMALGRRTAARLAAEGFDVALINPRYAKPIDAGTTEFFGRAAEVVVTFEDHALAGGYGSAVLEMFSENRITTPVVQIGWPDQFIEHATSVEELRQKYGLTVENAVAKVKAEFAGDAVPSVRLTPLLQ